jgi:hypothetical protein
MWYFATLSPVSTTILGSLTYKDHVQCRSIAATAIFFVSGSITARIMHKDMQPSGTIVDWTLNTKGMELLSLQAIPLFFNLFIYALVGHLFSVAMLLF